MATKTWDAASGRFVKDDLDHVEKLKRLRRLNGIARLMDTAIRIPGTGIRFGADSVFGLIPVIGDAGGALVGLYLINEARRMGVPSAKLVQMLGNLGVDAFVGSVPVAGDLFDLFFKSHRRNLDIILDHFDLRREDLR
ncbi:DUF4112 domain-containing protein [Aliirhizobium cellulosilyticum]|uniref:DUF4112 domain-containing protein n=2 Tax=Rhizobiaceae TaxID=82115 RepID=A0A7W6TM06_9HYPH|nr:DUF4112 domain-containing protein [Rhizobium cellulosilyticum]MBB4351668.1 hypothetical protein [Rhizobium cellulosilyticum]MBB4414995.1 hypothetical protein [Rhizobium cellulosilyticum]MBB4449594.1 hypothetical protein [Rhizobium cellulosilyticum]